MTDYIDRMAVRNELFEADAITMQGVKIINQFPAADVKPVVRGEWIPKNTDGSWRVETCSACKKDTHYVRYAPPYDYCPNCGADMREAKA